MSEWFFFLLMIYGCVWGSFLTVVGLRIPINQPIVFSRSCCPHCEHPLAFVELIPLLSILIQKGKCRQCKEPISVLYPLTEWMTGLLFAVSFWYAPLHWETTLTLFLLLSFGIIFSVTDLAYRILPNKIMFWFLIAVFILNSFFHQADFYHYLLNGLGFFSFFYMFYLLFPNSIGGGDVKCYGVLAFLLGYQISLLAVLFASGLACTVFFCVRLFKRIPKDLPIPFAPFIFIGAYLAYLTSPQLINFLNLLLYIS